MFQGVAGPQGSPGEVGDHGPMVCWQITQRKSYCDERWLQFVDYLIEMHGYKARLVRPGSLMWAIDQAKLLMVSTVQCILAGEADIMPLALLSALFEMKKNGV